MTTYFELPKLPGLKKFSAVLMHPQTREVIQMKGQSGLKNIETPQESGGELDNVFDAMMLLPKEQRNILIMINVHGMRYAEAAEKLGISVETLRDQLSDAREALENLLMKDPQSCKAVS